MNEYQMQIRSAIERDLVHAAYMVENAVNNYRKTDNWRDEVLWLADLVFFAAEARAQAEEMSKLIKHVNDIPAQSGE